MMKSAKTGNAPEQTVHTEEFSKTLVKLFDDLSSHILRLDEAFIGDVDLTIADLLKQQQIWKSDAVIARDDGIHEQQTQIPGNLPFPAHRLPSFPLTQSFLDLFDNALTECKSVISLAEDQSTASASLISDGAAFEADQSFKESKDSDPQRSARHTPSTQKPNSSSDSSARVDVSRPAHPGPLSKSSPRIRPARQSSLRNPVVENTVKASKLAAATAGTGGRVSGDGTGTTGVVGDSAGSVPLEKVGDDKRCVTCGRGGGGRSCGGGGGGGGGGGYESDSDGSDALDQRRAKDGKRGWLNVEPAMVDLIAGGRHTVRRVLQKHTQRRRMVMLTLLDTLRTAILSHYDCAITSLWNTYVERKKFIERDKDIGIERVRRATQVTLAEMALVQEVMREKMKQDRIGNDRALEERLARREEQLRMETDMKTAALVSRVEGMVSEIAQLRSDLTTLQGKYEQSNDTVRELTHINMRKDNQCHLYQTKLRKLQLETFSISAQLEEAQRQKAAAMAKAARVELEAEETLAKRKADLDRRYEQQKKILMAMNSTDPSAQAFLDAANISDKGKKMSIVQGQLNTALAKLRKYESEMHFLRSKLQASDDIDRKTLAQIIQEIHEELKEERKQMRERNSSISRSDSPLTLVPTIGHSESPSPVQTPASSKVIETRADVAGGRRARALTAVDHQSMFRRLSSRSVREKVSPRRRARSMSFKHRKEKSKSPKESPRERAKAAWDRILAPPSPRTGKDAIFKIMERQGSVPRQETSPRSHVARLQQEHQDQTHPRPQSAHGRFGTGAGAGAGLAARTTAQAGRIRPSSASAGGYRTRVMSDVTTEPHRVPVVVPVLSSQVSLSTDSEYSLNDDDAEYVDVAPGATPPALPMPFAQPREEPVEDFPHGESSSTRRTSLEADVHLQPQPQARVVSEHLLTRNHGQEAMGEVIDADNKAAATSKLIARNSHTGSDIFPNPYMSVQDGHGSASECAGARTTHCGVGGAVDSDINCGSAGGGDGVSVIGDVASTAGAGAGSSHGINDHGGEYDAVHDNSNTGLGGGQQSGGSQVVSGDAASNISETDNNEKIAGVPCNSSSFVIDTGTEVVPPASAPGVPERKAGERPFVVPKLTIGVVSAAGPPKPGQESAGGTATCGKELHASVGSNEGSASGVAASGGTLIEARLGRVVASRTGNVLIGDVVQPDSALSSTNPPCQTSTPAVDGAGERPPRGDEGYQTPRAAVEMPRPWTLQPSPPIAASVEEIPKGRNGTDLYVVGDQANSAGPSSMPQQTGHSTASKEGEQGVHANPGPSDADGSDTVRKDQDPNTEDGPDASTERTHEDKTEGSADAASRRAQGSLMWGSLLGSVGATGTNTSKQGRMRMRDPPPPPLPGTQKPSSASRTIALSKYLRKQTESHPLSKWQK